MSAAPLSCPFCGGSPELHHGPGNITYVLCDECGAITSFRPNLAGSRTVAAWNRRAPPLTGNWISADDEHRLVREIDVALNGEAGAAKQAALCDIASQIGALARELKRPVLDAIRASQSTSATLREHNSRIERWCARERCTGKSRGGMCRDCPREWLVAP